MRKRSCSHISLPCCACFWLCAGSAERTGPGSVWKCGGSCKGIHWLSLIWQSIFGPPGCLDVFQHCWEKPQHQCNVVHRSDICSPVTATEWWRFVTIKTVIRAKVQNVDYCSEIDVTSKSIFKQLIVSLYIKIWKSDWVRLLLTL